ncbi:MAG: helix-hairpin-helix domain-containing protein [Fimbriimonadales bacterium]|nr:helix-hairpin-helix domain-containing protein [Fimbriimonadales bacterium]
MSNEAIAQQLEELAELSDFVGDSPFKSRAYRQAARTLEMLQTPIETLAEQGIDALKGIPGIGEAIAEKILAYLQTGSIPKREQLLQTVPAGILEVMAVPGIGAKTARLLHEQLGVHDLQSLRHALMSGAADTLPHFSPHKRERLLRLIDLKHKSQRRTPLGFALPRGRELLQTIKGLDGVQRALLGGSARRMQEDVGDLDFLAATEQPTTVIEAFVRAPFVAEVYAQGANKAQIFLSDGLQVDLKTVPPDSWGAGVVYITGSKAHSIRLRQRAMERGLKLNEYGVWRGAERVAADTEDAVYAALGLPLIPPPLREDRGEIEAAEQGRLPALVQVSQVRGDLQCHSTWSDGFNTLEELAQTAAALGYEYLAITDHAHMLGYEGDLVAAFEQRRREIDALNERLGGRPYLLNALEVNILADGALYAPEALLHAAQLVLAGVHDHHGQPREQMTQRLLRALEHPAVDILAHPTGRRYGKRLANDADWERIFERARALGKAVEINGYPTRMDPPTPIARMLVESGAWISLGTDSHAARDLYAMELAVGLAQRAWATPERILNTRSVDALLQWLHDRRQSC